MEKSHFIELGSHPEISLSELRAVLGPSERAQQAGKRIALLDHALKSPARFAGIVKHGEIVGSASGAKELPALIASLLPEAPEQRIRFGLSLYPGDDASAHGRLRRELQRVGLATKRLLKERGVPARFVSSKEDALSAVIVTTNRLIERGADIALIPHDGGVLIGRTDWVQDFKAWSSRDYGRPARDAASGMLPPKLARAMINLTGADPSSSSLLDPFCGSGTVLMEASLLGFGRIVGSDLSEKAVRDSRENLAWLEHMGNAIPPHDLIVSPAQELGERLDERFDAIVAETFLGEPQTGNESTGDLRAELERLERLHRVALPALARLLKPGGRMALAFPAYRDGAMTLPLKAISEGAGLAIIDPLPEHKKSPNGGLLYQRKGQHVAREILVMGLG